MNNNQLESITLLIQHINNQLTKPVFSKQEIKTELENAQELSKVQVEINLLLNELLNANIKDTNEVSKKLILLHLRLCDFEWHIEKTHAMVKDLIAEYNDHV